MVNMTVQEANPAELIKAVKDPYVDFAVGPVLNEPDFSFDTVLKEDLFALIPKRFGYASEQTITVDRLSTIPLLLLNTASALRASLADAFDSLGLKLFAKFEFSQAQTLISMAQAGLGAAVLPGAVVPQPVLTGIDALRIEHEGLYREIAIITRRNHKLSPTSSRLAELVRDLI